jgi:hypothetical protein
MDDIARDIAERQAVLEHNEYLADAVKRPVQIEVHVLRELTGRRHNSSPRAHFHRPSVVGFAIQICEVIEVKSKPQMNSCLD